MSDLSPKEMLFLEYLFDDAECMGNTKLAAQQAGYGATDHSRLVRKMKDEILKRTQETLVASAPIAVGKLIDAMDEDGTTPKAAERMKAIEGVLDRCGVSRKQEMVFGTVENTPLFFIPAKQLGNQQTEIKEERDDTE